jgi:eukaryotic-like serine/threonine-protein kinase
MFPMMGGRVGDETLPVRESGSATTAERFAIGSIAAGRYRIERFIAAGGMGEVYAAHDIVLDTTVALKTLRPELEGSADAIARLRREIALARSVTDPHICRIHDVGVHDGRVFLSMELLEGRTLAELVRAPGLAIAEVERIAAQLVVGLGALHGASIIHRDFKTANVIVVGDGDGTRAVITDFGLARSLDSTDARLTIESGLLGTPAYMAPEQVEARPATKASDIYSLGIVLFELLTGKLPFDEDTAMATATARLTKDPPRPSSLRSDIPARWDAIVLRCLERDPAERFADVADILGHRPMSRRWFLAAGGGAAAAASLGVWRLAVSAAEDTPAVVRSPDDVIAVLPVLGEGSWLTDAWRSAITFDLHDALATVGVPILALLGHQMDTVCHGAAAVLAEERDPVTAALALPNVKTVVTLTLSRTAGDVALDVMMTGAVTWRGRSRRAANEIGLLLHDVATGIAVSLGYPLPRMPADARTLDAALYERYGKARAGVYQPMSEDESKLIQAQTVEWPTLEMMKLAKQAPQLTRALAIRADMEVMAAEQQKDYAQTEARLAKAAEMANRVLSADPTNALAHAVLGHIAMLRWDWPRADAETKRAIELAPLHERVVYHRNFLLMLVGRFDDAIEQAEQMYRRNPHPRLGKAMLAWHYFYARRYAEVIRVVEPVIDKYDPTNFVERLQVSLLPVAYADMARFDDGVRAADQLRAKLEPYEQAVLVGVYKMAGRNDQARALADKIRVEAGPGGEALIADALGETERTLTVLEQLVASHNIHAIFLRIDRYSPEVRAHPRFQVLLKQVGFPS